MIENDRVEAPGTTIDTPARDRSPARWSHENDRRLWNDVPMETQERFPQGLGNLAQHARFPHSHKPIILWNGT
jgi:hypothetical protein